MPQWPRAHRSDAMDSAYLAAHVEEDREHWWFRGRLAVLLAVLRARLPRRRLTLVELGCGTGNVLATLGEFGEAVGVERDDRLRAVALAAGLEVRRGALPDDVPIDPGTADVVLLLDVLEHLEDEAASLAAARTLLAPGGLLVLTVPAYAWLWSAHGVHLGHRRRYTRSGLGRVVAEARFVVERVTYFNTLLFPVVAGVRMANRALRRAGHDLSRPPVRCNRALTRIFAAERHLLARTDLPVGSSLLLIARA